MIEIEIKDSGADISLIFLRFAFLVILIIHIVFKLDNPAHDLTNILALWAILLVYFEVKQAVPSQLQKVVVAPDLIEFIYVGPTGSKLIVSLPVSGKIALKRSFWSNKVSVHSGSNRVLLPWYLNQKNQNKIQSVLVKNP